MNTNAAPRDHIDYRLIDRLVDGELVGPQREALLRAFDVEPGAWRRCALAFLEAQAWRGALGRPGLAADHPAEGSSRERPRAGRPHVQFITGIAAAVVIAFLAGFLSRGLDGESGSPSHDREHPQFALKRDPMTGPSEPAPRPAGPGTPPAADESALRIPVLVADPRAAGEMLGQPSALPEYVRRQLQRRGYEVEGDRKLMSVALKDGRNVTLPVETFKYRYVGYRVH